MAALSAERQRLLDGAERLACKTSELVAASRSFLQCPRAVLVPGWFWLAGLGCMLCLILLVGLPLLIVFSSPTVENHMECRRYSCDWVVDWGNSGCAGGRCYYVWLPRINNITGNWLWNWGTLPSSCLGGPPYSDPYTQCSGCGQGALVTNSSDGDAFPLANGTACYGPPPCCRYQGYGDQTFWLQGWQCLPMLDGCI